MPDLFEEFSELGRKSSQIPPDYRETLKPVTVRLDTETLCCVDTLAQFTGLSRQALLAKIINTGVSTAQKAFLESAPDLEADYEHQYQMCVTHEEMNK